MYYGPPSFKTQFKIILLREVFSFYFIEITSSCGAAIARPYSNCITILIYICLYAVLQKLLYVIFYSKKNIYLPS